MKDCIKAIFVIIGTVIGAGFASGQEIYSFFNVHRENGILGIIISSIIIGIVIFNVLKKVNLFNINNYGELLEKTKMSNKVRQIVQIIVNIFLLMSFYIMVAGFSAYFKQEFAIPNLVITIIILVICYITFMKNIEGIAKINSIIIPILIIIVLIMGYKSNVFYIFNNIDTENIKIKINWIIRSIEYVGYNTILLIPILISIRKYTKNNESKITILTTSILLIMSLIIYLIMYRFDELSNIEIPLTYIANSFGNIFKNIYGIVIIFAIYTTMISAGYGFLQNLSNNKKTYKILTSFLCMSAIFISNFSFSSLVNLTYPVFGVLGIMQLFFIIRY